MNNYSRTSRKFPVFVLIDEFGVILSAWLKHLDAVMEYGRLEESGLHYGVKIQKVTVSK